MNDFIALALKKFGYKIVKLEDYIDEILKIDFNYYDKSPEYIPAKIKEVIFVGLKRNDL